MIDEHFIREWNAAHSRLSEDIGNAFAKLGKLLGSRAETPKPIGRTYASGPHEQAQAELQRAANSLLSALAAVATTTALFVTVGALTVPASADAATAQPQVTWASHDGVMLL